MFPHALLKFDIKNGFISDIAIGHHGHIVVMPGCPVAILGDSPFPIIPASEGMQENQLVAKGPFCLDGTDVLNRKVKRADLFDVRCYCLKFMRNRCRSGSPLDDHPWFDIRCNSPVKNRWVLDKYAVIIPFKHSSSDRTCLQQGLLKSFDQRIEEIHITRSSKLVEKSFTPLASERIEITDLKTEITGKNRDVDIFRESVDEPIYFGE